MALDGKEHVFSFILLKSFELSGHFASHRFLGDISAQRQNWAAKVALYQTVPMMVYVDRGNGEGAAHVGVAGIAGVALVSLRAWWSAG